MKTPHAISSSIFPTRTASPRNASPSSAPARNAAAICRQRVPFPVAFSSSNGQAASPTAPAAIASFNPIRKRTRRHPSPHPSPTQQSTASPTDRGQRVLTASLQASLYWRFACRRIWKPVFDGESSTGRLAHPCGLARDCKSLPSDPRGISTAHLNSIKTRRVPQVRCLNLGLGVDVFFHGVCHAGGTAALL